MTRRVTASVVGAVALLALLVAVFVVPGPWVVYSPGPTVNLLGKSGGQQIVDVDGAKVYRDKGDLRLLTVVPTGPDDHVSLGWAAYAWVDPSQSVYRYEDIYQKQETSDAVQQEGQVDMVSSQDSAVASALHALGYKFGTSVQVLGVTKGGPGDGVLKVRDRIVSVDGAKVASIQAAVAAIRKVEPGDKVALGIVRDGKARTLRITTEPSKDDASQSALQVTIGVGYAFPIDVQVRIGEQIGGPSAGMMFALSIYDTLTPGSLTGGSDIAGTGTIDGDGNVGPIGGIQQKLVGAERAGARLFLAPADNCDEVRGGPYDPDRMRVVKVKTFDQALGDVKAWAADHDAKLPSC